MFYILSFVVCIIINIKAKHSSNLTLSTINTLSVVNYITFAVLIITSIMSIFTMVGSVVSSGVFISSTDVDDISGAAAAPMSGFWSGIGLLLVLIAVFIVLFVWHIKNIRKLIFIKNDLIEKSVVYCNHCGMAVPCDTMFCPECGSEITKEENA